MTPPYSDALERHSCARKLNFTKYVYSRVTFSYFLLNARFKLNDNKKNQCSKHREVFFTLLLSVYRFYVNCEENTFSCKHIRKVFCYLMYVQLVIHFNVFRILYKSDARFLYLCELISDFDKQQARGANIDASCAHSFRISNQNKTLPLILNATHVSTSSPSRRPQLSSLENYIKMLATE